MGRTALLIVDMISSFDFEDGEKLAESAHHAVPNIVELVRRMHEEDVDRVVLTGVVTEQRILYSALDAYLRHFQVVVPRDAVAHISERLAEAALEMMQRNLHAEVTTAAEARLS
jgi:nicotinamidase-related amidase